MAKLEGIRSLDLILEEVRSERDLQLSHFDAIDTKAGIVLGFAGALVALAPRGAELLLDLGRALAVACGFTCLSAFWPRRYWSTNLRPFRDKYLAAELEFTKIHLLDTQIGMADRMSGILASKAMRLKLAMIALALAVFLTAVGVVLD
ncbi:MAG TPA: hypothetical protein VIH70_03240 [Actinomycetota bacterium]|jgi:hypothetical protein